MIAEPDVETEDATLEDIKKIPQVVIAHPPPPAAPGEAGGALRNSVKGEGWRSKMDGLAL